MTQPLKHNVAVTGIGVLTAGYTDPEDLFTALSNGHSVIDDDPYLKAGGVEGIASGALQEDQIGWLESTYPQTRGHRTGLAGKILFHVATQAMDHAGLLPGPLPPGSSLFIGINKNLISATHIHSMLKRYDYQSSTLSPRTGSRHHDLDLLRPDQAVEPLARHLNHDGPVQIHSDACAAGASAVVSGFRRIASGRTDLAVCGAAEHGAHPIMQLMFARLGALCRKTYESPLHASRPFDKERSGCVLSDAGAVLILENEDKALKRGARILARIAGASRLSEAFRITTSDSGGDFYARTMNSALQDAGITPDRIDHINAHGTSTISNDKAESRAIHQLFQAGPSVTSTKSALGHSLAASGAIELILSILSLKHQRALPILNFTEPGPSEPWLKIFKQSQPQAMKLILSNSFGFGGENVSIVVSGEEP